MLARTNFTLDTLLRCHTPPTRHEPVDCGSRADLGDYGQCRRLDGDAAGCARARKGSYPCRHDGSSCRMDVTHICHESLRHVARPLALAHLGRVVLHQDVDRAQALQDICPDARRFLGIRNGLVFLKNAREFGDTYALEWRAHLEKENDGNIEFLVAKCNFPMSPECASPKPPPPPGGPKFDYFD